MPTLKHHSQKFLMGCFLLFFLACNTLTSVNTPTPKPDLTDAAEATLLPLEYFPQAIYFAHGGGGDDSEPKTNCNSPERREDIQIISVNKVCVWGLSMGEPIHLEITSPEGITYRSNNIWFNRTFEGWFTKDEFTTQWEEYGAVSVVINNFTYSGVFFTDNNTVLELDVWFPATLEGAWKIRAVGDEYDVSTNFILTRDNLPDLVVSNHQKPNVISPFGYDQFNQGSHSLLLEDDLSITGANFPPNALIYLVLYKNESIVKFQEVMSDANGLIKEIFFGPFDTASYTLVGISKKDLDAFYKSEATEMRYLGAPGLHYDRFGFNNSTSSQNVCIGAPPQRMTVNKQGEVCTQGDGVYVRSEPLRSATKITKLETGSPFTVIGGPACADNWSWWKIRLNDGREGWIAEGWDEIDSYFICPIK